MNHIEWVLEQGGWVSYALAGVSILMWSAVCLRMIALRPSMRRGPGSDGEGYTILAHFVREARRLNGSQARLEQLAERTRAQFATMHGFIKTMVAVAPLLGLLGTVIGMIEMFASLKGAQSIGGGSTVAGGISTALVTTQLGLMIAVPGLIASYLLTRQQLRRERDLSKLLRSMLRTS